jgi:uncharacterized protein (DUF697 family)
VVDGDLRSAEWDVVRSLAGLGKRLMLVLNKCDLRGEEEEKRLLALLRGRCKGLLTAEDVIPTSASPQSLPRPGQKPWQPPAEVAVLLQRLAVVLHADGEELLADNILLQCRTLGDKGRSLLNRQRQTEARRIVDRYSWISAGVVAATPLPGIDLLGTAAVNAQMVMEVAKVYNVQLTRAKAQELAVSVGRTLAGLGVVKGGVALIGTALSVNLPTLLLGKAVQGVAAAWLTRIAGASFIRIKIGEMVAYKTWCSGITTSTVAMALFNDFSTPLLDRWWSPCGSRQRSAYHPNQGLGRRGTHRAAGIEDRNQTQIGHTN